MFSPAFAANKSLKIAAPEYPPFYGAELEDNGFMTEIVRAALDRGGYEATIDFLPWKRALASAQEGKHDALFLQFGIAQSAKSGFCFPMPYQPMSWYSLSVRTEISKAPNTKN